MRLFSAGGERKSLLIFRAAKKDSVLVKLPAAPGSVSIPFIGPLSLTKGAKSIKLCNIFGVDFWINPCSEDLQSAEVLVPAWHCKTVSKADQAFFTFTTKNVAVNLVALDDSLSSLLVSLGDFPLPIGPELNAKKFTLDCCIQCLDPLPDIDSKLEADLKKSREKTEKTIRNCINQSVKQSQKTNANAKKRQPSSSAAATNKRKRGDGDDAQDENAPPQQPGSASSGKTDWDALIKKAQEDQGKIDQIVQEAVAACKKPSVIPITRLSSEAERAQNSSRALLMQNVLKEKAMAEKKEAAEVAKNQTIKAVPSKLGAAAAVQAFQRDGVLTKGKKKTKAADSAAVAAENVMKLGKHVLK